jgi:N-acetylmuramoyl-L-alanine amidase
MGLRWHGVRMTRTGDTYPPPGEEADKANGWGAGVSLRRNSYSNPAISGGEALYGRPARWRGKQTGTQ